MRCEVLTLLLVALGCGRLEFDASECGFGWTTIVLVPTTPNASCPATFTDLALVTNATIDPAACECTCSISTDVPPSCARGHIEGMVGATACDAPAAGAVLDGPGCTPADANQGLAVLGSHPPLPFDPGVCVSTSRSTGIGPTSSPLHICVAPPTASCEEPVPGYMRCVVHDGDIACPLGPFQQRSLAGTSVAASCEGCETCANSATCSPTALLHFFGDAACATEIATRVVDNTCHPLGFGMAGDVIAAVIYEVSMSTPSCAPTSVPLAVPVYEGVRTVCCGPLD